MASAVIQGVRSTSGDQIPIRRINEKAAQVFLMGVPVQMDTTNAGIQEWDGSTIAQGIAGFSKEAASNLTTTGVAKTLTFGSVPNEANAVNIPRGAPLNDGRIGFEVANDASIFYGQVGPAQTTVASDVGKQYGMTKDGDNHWYVDKTKTGGSAVVVVAKLDYWDTARGVQFKVLQASQQQIF